MMRGSKRCSDFGSPVRDTDGITKEGSRIKKYFPWNSVQRKLEREICKRFAAAGDRSVVIQTEVLRWIFGDISEAEDALMSNQFRKQVQKLVNDVMYRVQMTYCRDSCTLVIVAVC